MQEIDTIRTRIRDAFLDPEQFLEEIDVSFDELISIMYNNGYVNSYTLPFIFEEEDNER